MSSEGGRSCGGVILLLVDVVNCLLGAAILGVGLYAYIYFNSFSVLVTLQSIYIGIAVGSGLIVVSLLGCVASTRGHKALLCIYLFLVFGLLWASVAAAVIAQNYIGKLNVFTPTYKSGSLTDGNQIAFNNIFLSAYTGCCTGCPPGACNATNVVTLKNDRWLANCLTTDNATVTPVCQLATFCTSTEDTGCYKDTDTVPASNVYGACSTLEGLKYNGTTPLVGPAENGSCGSGSPASFTYRCAQYLLSYWPSLQIAFTVFCVLQAFNFMVSVLVLMCQRDHK